MQFCSRRDYDICGHLPAAPDVANLPGEVLLRSPPVEVVEDKIKDSPGQVRHVGQDLV